MSDGTHQASIEETFYAAEQAGLKLAIKGRVITLIILGVLLVSTRSAEQAVKFGLAVTGFLVLGLCHFYVIGTVWDKRWTKYLFLSVDILLLSLAVAVVPPEARASVPQIFMFKFDVYPYYFLILGVAAFSFSPGLVLWAGLLGAGGWMGAFAWVRSQMVNPLEWSDIPADASSEQFIRIFLDPGFAATGSRIQEATIYLVVAILIAIVMHRARQTVRRQLAAEREMTTVSQIFGRFVPKAVADTMIKEKGTLDPVERQATVLFTDLAGFTNLTEAKGPRTIVDILNAYFDRATEIIGEHNGVVTQFQGDAILAIFNVPLDDTDHAKHAYEAAKDLLAVVDNETFAGEKLAIRIGINTGHVIAGNVGGGGRQSYTVHGDAVNLAARLESLNKEYDTSLLVSESTVGLLDNGEFTEIGEIHIRGLSERVIVFTPA